MPRLSAQNLKTLRVMASGALMLGESIFTGDRDLRRLLRCGLIQASDPDGGGLVITGDGLIELGKALNDGRLDYVAEWRKQKQEAQERKAAEAVAD